MKQVSNHSFLRLSMLVATALLLSFVPASFAQGLNWEGQTGAFVTPFAYVTSSPANSIGAPTVALHYLNAGSVIGNDVQLSGAVGLFKRIEVSYTRTLPSTANTPVLSPLFANGFNTFGGKLNLVPENFLKTQFPAISIGGVFRTNVERVNGVLNSKSTNNGDAYIVATKTITAFKPLPIVVNAGVKATNASIFGIAGNATSWTGSTWAGRGFGAVGLVLPAPYKAKVVVGSEVAQQPHHLVIPALDATANIPTTLTYFARVLPVPEKPFNVDFGIAQAAGQILPGVDVKARAQFAFGISYRL
jgi:hypothetical protein